MEDFRKKTDGGQWLLSRIPKPTTKYARNDAVLVVY